jgi:hypothetical protein
VGLGCTHGSARDLFLKGVTKFEEVVFKYQVESVLDVQEPVRIFTKVFRDFLGGRFNSDIGVH